MRYEGRAGMNIAEIAERIKERYTEGKTLIVGIDGLGGAGKSTVSEKLCGELRKEYNVTVLHIDDFIHRREVRYNDSFPQWECYYRLQWRYDYLKDIIMPVRDSKAFDGCIELYDKDNDTYILSHTNIPSGSIVMIEGIFLQRSELGGMFDFMIYIDIPEKIRLERVLDRDGYIGDREQIRAKYENRYFPAERYYTKMCSPAEKADFTVTM